MGGLIRRLGTHIDLSAGTKHMLNRRGTSSIEKAQKLLGYQPLVTLDEGMERVAASGRDEGLIEA